MAALFDTTEESRENKRCAGKGQKQTCRTAIQNQDGIVSGNGGIKERVLLIPEICTLGSLKKLMLLKTSYTENCK